jgi:L-proline---[L-prolyl-carrier protein] ligase
MGLHHLLEKSGNTYPDHVAVEEPGRGTMTYKELMDLSDHLRDCLYRLNVRPGDRVGIYLHKSIDAVATIFGIMKVGAIYVPVDPDAPVSRNGYILHDCSVKVIIAEQSVAEDLLKELTPLGEAPFILQLEHTGGGRFLKKALELQEAKKAFPKADTHMPLPDDLAYFLYTSGSTGKPKGVMLTHRNAMSFVDWCSEYFAPNQQDRFSSHAPFHFDLSIFDLYVSIKHGATLVLIGEKIGKDPLRLAPLIATSRITIWYSAPTTLSLLAQYGHLTRYDFSALRLILFAGEVFPVKHLRTLKTLLPLPKCVNLYGPTETNVCTAYEIPAQVADEQQVPFPIGRSCFHLRTMVVDEFDHSVKFGEEGELCVAGPAIMRGYWNLPERSAGAFFTDDSGQQWYKTGDVVVEQPDGNYMYMGRRDRMIKKRGYRIELGEIETALYAHPDVQEVAVIAMTDAQGDVKVKAFVSLCAKVRPSIIALKGFCAERIPSYMIPDLFVFQEKLPRTSTDKVNYQTLKELVC